MSLNLAETLNHRGRNYLLKDLPDTSGLTFLDKKIIAARCKGISFCNLNEADTTLAVDQIMIRIAGLYGCSLPTTEFYARFIADEITIFFKEFGYEYLTLEEILLAFRLNVMPSAEKIQFTGTCVNVDFISKVINEYLNTRKLLDRKLQNKIDGYEL